MKNTSISIYNSYYSKCLIYIRKKLPNEILIWRELRENLSYKISINNNLSPNRLSDLILKQVKNAKI